MVNMEVASRTENRDVSADAQVENGLAKALRRKRTVSKIAKCRSREDRVPSFLERVWKCCCAELANVADELL